MSALSPNTLNLQVPKGILSFQLNATGTYVDLGDCTSFKITPQVETKDHYSSRTGTKSLDYSPVTQIGGEVSFDLDEVNMFNLSLALLGVLTTPAGATAPTGTTPGTGQLVTIMQQPQIRGVVRVVGTNDVGPKITYDGILVQLTPSGGLSVIEDDYTKLSFTGKLLKNPSAATVAGIGYGTAVETT